MKWKSGSYLSCVFEAYVNIICECGKVFQGYYCDENEYFEPQVCPYCGRNYKVDVNVLIEDENG